MKNALAIVVAACVLMTAAIIFSLSASMPIHAQGISVGGGTPFTTTDARTSISGGSGISYDNTTGTVSLSSTIAPTNVNATTGNFTSLTTTNFTASGAASLAIPYLNAGVLTTTSNLTYSNVGGRLTLTGGSAPGATFNGTNPSIAVGATSFSHVSANVGTEIYNNGVLVGHITAVGNLGISGMGAASAENLARFYVSGRNQPATALCVLQGALNQTGHLLRVTMSNGSSYPQAAVITATGKMAVGTQTPTAWLDVMNTTEQLRVGYDASNYVSTTVASTGATTVDVTASSVPVIAYADWTQQTAGRSRVANDVTNETATMANVTGLSATLLAGRKYAGKIILYVNDSVAADGLKVDFDGGAATMTSFRAHATVFDTALVLSAQTSALATDFAVATVTGDAMVEIHFAFVCNAAGTFIPRFAQNAHTVGTATAYANSFMMIEDMP